MYTYMIIINKNKTPKTPRPGWELLRGDQTHCVHMGNSCADGVM